MIVFNIGELDLMTQEVLFNLMFLIETFSPVNLVPLFRPSNQTLCVFLLCYEGGMGKGDRACTE